MHETPFKSDDDRQNGTLRKVTYAGFSFHGDDLPRASSA